MGRKRATEAAAPPINAGQEFFGSPPATTTQPQPATAGGSVSKVDAVRSAISALGQDSSNQDLTSYIISHFGNDAVPGNLSVTKSSVLKKLREEGGGAATPARRGRRPGSKNGAASTQPATHVAKRPSQAGVPAMGLASAVQQLNGLVRQFGRDEVKNLVEVLGGD